MNFAEAANILGVSENASDDEIKKAFRTLAAKNHPDVNKEIGAEDKFKQINQAFQILTGKEKPEREFHGGSGFDGSGMSMNDIFNDIFMRGGMNSPFESQFSHFNHQQKQRGRVVIEDVYIEHRLSFKECVLGCSKKISYDIKHFCETCEAHGINLKTKKPCDACKGKGVISHSFGGGGFIQINRTICPQCQGTGSSGETCVECKGQKYKVEHISVMVKIPAIGDNQVQLCVNGKGNKYKNKSSNAYLVLYPTVQGKDEFEGYFIEGKNVKVVVSIGLDKLLFGGKEKIKLVDGQEIDIDVPAGTKAFDEIAVGQHGVGDQYGKIKGYHIAVVEAKYPKNLTEKLKEELEIAYKE